VPADAVARDRKVGNGLSFIGCQSRYERQSTHSLISGRANHGTGIGVGGEDNRASGALQSSIECADIVRQRSQWNGRCNSRNALSLEEADDPMPTRSVCPRAMNRHNCRFDARCAHDSVLFWRSMGAVRRNGTDAALNLSTAVLAVTSSGLGLEAIPMVDQRPAPIFVADSPGLDFLNSIAIPVDAQVEWIGSGEDLIAWLVRAGMVPPEAIAELRKRVVPGEFDSVAAQARKLREWFRGFVKAHRGRPLQPKTLQELEPLNRVLARDEEFGQVAVREIERKKAGRAAHGEPSVSRLVWRTQRRWRSPDALLFPIARAMAELVCDEDFRRVKACEGHRCTLMFVDRTRGHARRWCSMSVCGNRAKQAAHRQRALRARK